MSKEYNSNRTILFERGSSEYNKVKDKNRRVKNKLDIGWRLQRIFYSIKHRCKTKNYDLDFDYNYLLKLYKEQNGKCSVTGVKFELEDSEEFIRSPNSPSVDRIDSTKGYTKDNIRLVTTQVNIAISEFGYDLFISMCSKAITQKDKK